ncbi:MAG: hydrogenase formation protein HypD [Clostridiales bacterium]|nr:hydrogenase formation protein HypD [Clostridiales bacterium]
MTDIKAIAEYLKSYDGEEINLMEVCGTHTASIAKNGIESIISEKIHLISGPGCPVCVTVSEYIDALCSLAWQKNTTVVTFADMLRVRGGKYSPGEAKALGASVISVYSPFEIIKLAQEKKDETFVFAAVGFETTAPIYAVLAQEIIEKGIGNIKFLTSLKVMPPAIRYICENSPKIDGFIAPGHVSTITGANAFAGLAREFSKPFVISGFEGDEILASIYLLVRLRGRGDVKNLYKSAVKAEPNAKAAKLINKYFEYSPAAWRGLGIMQDSGLYFRAEYSFLDAGSRNLINDAENNGCKCADVLSGKIRSSECPLFKTICTPETPMGACMVSGEGACFNYYINNRG